jgi:putative redox protein
VPVDISIAYEGHLRCTATHAPSGVTLHTDAATDLPPARAAAAVPPPVAASFSSTDLLAASLGASVMTTMSVAARQRGIDLSGATATVRKEMATTPSRRVGRVTVEFHVPRELPDEQRAALEWAARSCPVRRSLHPDIDVPIEFHWGAAAPDAEEAVPQR